MLRPLLIPTPVTRIVRGGDLEESVRHLRGCWICLEVMRGDIRVESIAIDVRKGVNAAQIAMRKRF